MKHVSSRDNPLFKQLLKLAQSSRERKKSQQTLIEGIHLVKTFRESVGVPKTLILSANGTQNGEIIALTEQCHSLTPVVLSDAMFNELSTLDSPVGVIAQIDTPIHKDIPANLGSCVVLEDIQDPGNLGSILRSAAAADVKQVILSKACVFAWSPRVVRAAMGAHFLLEIYEQQDLFKVLSQFPGKKIATALRAKKSLYETDLHGLTAFLIGNEGNGLSPALLSLADEIVTIPMPGKIESMNVAAAAAICLFERVRQLQ